MENHPQLERIKQLLLLRINGYISKREEKELLDLCKSFPELTELVNSINAEYIKNELAVVSRLSERKELVWQGLRGKLGFTSRNIGLIRKAVIAASVILISGASYFYFTNSPKSQHESAKQLDIALIKGNAVLTLSTGEKVELNARPKDSIQLRESSNSIVNINSELIYKQTHSATTSTGYNTVSTPQNVVFKLTLSDGTKVWLNSLSSIKFPLNFTHTEREVEITGEVYFEISKDKKRSFIVTADNVSVQVLGTRFNFKASGVQKNEITLLDGAIIVKNQSNKVLLKPGQQAQTNIAGDIITTQNIHLDQITAWQQGYFVFTNTPLREAIKQLQSTYDFQVEYKGIVPDIPFNAKFSKELPFPRILEILGKTETVRFKIEGKKVIVTAS